MAVADPGDGAAPRSAKDAAQPGLAAFERGDWKTARSLLQEVARSQGRKQDRIRAEEIAGSLAADGFALKLAAFLAALFFGLVFLIL